MQVSLGALEPGTEIKHFIIDRKEESGFIDKILFGGKELPLIHIPYGQYLIKGDTLLLFHYEQAGEVAASFSRSELLRLTGGATLSTEELIKKNTRNIKFILGTDKFGRDYLSRLMSGTLISLSVGLIAVIISLIIGVSFGSIAGYYGGKADRLIQWFTNVVWSVPTLLMVMAITLALGKGFYQVFIAVGLTMWVEVARVTRGQILSLREKEYVEAARVMGFSDLRIILRHLLPGCYGTLIVISASNFATAILLEAGLSFLGVGAQPPMASWGGMMREHYGYLLLGKPWLALIPGIAISLLVLAFVMLGNALRDLSDVKRASVFRS
jgi:peptide/nickel transport system permease protein